LNLELFIAKKILFDNKKNKTTFSIINIAVGGIAIGLTVMILAIAILAGFKTEIRKKVSGFGSHLQILNHDSNLSMETNPVNKNQFFYPYIDSLPGIKHIQVFGQKAGIIKTEDDFMGVLLKGIDEDYDWSFFSDNIIEGSSFNLTKSERSNEIIISKYIASRLKLSINDKITVVFPQEPPRIRRFDIKGIYDTGLIEFDKVFLLCDIGHIQRLNNWDTEMVSGFEIIIDEFDQLAEIKEIIYQLVGSTFLDDGTKLKVVDIKDKNPEIFDLLKLYDTNVWVILSLMLIVAGFNMVSGLLILILERTNMIGILKALGAEDFAIRKIFLWISAFLISKGMLWGNIIGLGICFIQYKFQIIKLNPANYDLSFVPINLNVSHIMLLNLGTMIITLFMLIFPSFIISRISPDKTLKFK